MLSGKVLLLYRFISEVSNDAAEDDLLADQNGFVLGALIHVDVGLRVGVVDAEEPGLLPPG